MCILFVLLDDETTVFQIEAHSDSSVLDLKELVLAARSNALRNFDAVELLLYQLNDPVPLKQTATFATCINDNGDISTFGTILEDGTASVESIFPDYPRRPDLSSLHLFVKRPTLKRHGVEGLVSDKKKRQKILAFRLKSHPEASDNSIDTSIINKLHLQIQKISDDEKSYSDPSHYHCLPFPSTNDVPLRFSVSETHSISYMGRERFADVWKAWIKVKAEIYYRQAIYVYGSMGYGKSHILAALACLLIRKGERVVYIPDWRAMLRKPLTYLQNAFLMAFPDPDSAVYENWASRCTTYEELLSLCDHYRRMKGQLCFIVDQFYAFDEESLGEDYVTNENQNQLLTVINELSAEHILITSASANHRTAKYMAAKQTDDHKIALLGGMTPTEMNSWWSCHAVRFKEFSIMEQQRTEDLTGRIPLLLHTILKRNGATLKFMEPDIWEDEVLASVVMNVLSFVEKKYLSLSPDKIWTPSRSSLFYLDTKGFARYSCGLARQAIIKVLREYGEESLFLGGEWLTILENLKNNPSAIGFTVGQVVISSIASNGLDTGTLTIPPTKIKTFRGTMTRLARDKGSTLYVPLRFSTKAFDALFVRVDTRNNTAYVVPIQIAVASWNSDSESAFFSDWEEWILGLEGFEIVVSFLWIHEGERGRREVQAQIPMVRHRTILSWPDYRVHWVSVEQVHTDLARSLARIRPQYKSIET